MSKFHAYFSPAAGRQGLGAIRALLGGEPLRLARAPFYPRALPLVGGQSRAVLAHSRWFSSLHAGSTLQGNTAAVTIQGPRSYSTEKPLTGPDLKRRVLDVCKAFDKINADKLTEDCHFMNDLGLDSLDQVELIMAMEDEFGFEIPDADAEKLLRPVDVIKYVAGRENIDA